MDALLSIWLPGVQKCMFLIKMITKRQVFWRRVETDRRTERQADIPIIQIERQNGPHQLAECYQTLSKLRFPSPQLANQV